MTNWKNDSYLENNPAGSKIVYKPIEKEEHEGFSMKIKKIAPEER